MRDATRPTGSARMKKYLITGLLVWLPAAITVWVLLWVLGLLDGVFAWLLGLSAAVLPDGARQTVEALRQVPGLGVIVLLVLLALTGLAVTNFAGQWALGQWDRLLGNIPIVKSI